MSRLHCQSPLAWAIVVTAALFGSRPADAQVTNDPGPPREPGGLINNFYTGVQYDIVNQQLAERRLQKLQGKIRRDAERCRSAAVDRDARRIDSLQYRIVVDEWLIRKNSLQDPGCYPHAYNLDPISRAALANVARPAPPPFHPQPSLVDLARPFPMPADLKVPETNQLAPLPSLYNRQPLPMP